MHLVWGPVGPTGSPPNRMETIMPNRDSRYDDTLNDVYGPVSVAGFTYDTVADSAGAE